MDRATIKDKKCRKRIYGRSTGKETGLIVSTAILGILDLALLGAVVFQYLAGDSDYLIFLVLFIVLTLESSWLMALLARHFKHSRELKEKYERLPSARREEVLSLAEGYKSKWGLCFNGHYIYGDMSRMNKGSRGIRQVLSFEYIRLEEIAWIYPVEKQLYTGSSYIPGAVSVMNLPGEFCLYTYDGVCYKASGAMETASELFPLIQEVNPNCKLGYQGEG